MNTIMTTTAELHRLKLRDDFNQASLESDYLFLLCVCCSNSKLWLSASGWILYFYSCLSETENPFKNIGLIKMQMIILQLDAEQLFQAGLSGVISAGMEKRLLPTIHILRQHSLSVKGFGLCYCAPSIFITETFSPALPQGKISYPSFLIERHSFNSDMPLVQELCHTTRVKGSPPN